MPRRSRRRRNKKKNKSSLASQRAINGKKQEQTGPNHQAITTNQKPERSAIDSSITQPPAHDKEWQNEQKRYWERQIRIAKWLNGITLVAAIVGIGGLAFLAIQTNIGKKTIEISQRPWVAISKPIEIDTPLTFDSVGASITTKITIKNGGNSIANLALPVPQITFTHERSEVERKQRETCSTGLSRHQAGYFMFPADERPYVFSLRTPIKQIKTNSQGRTMMWLVGCVRYWDQFDIVHYSPFVYTFTVVNFVPEGVIKGEFNVAPISSRAT